VTHLIEVGGRLINTDEILYTRATPNTALSTTEIFFKTQGAERLPWIIIDAPLQHVNAAILSARAKDALR
jgi:hypothetical protein